MLQSVVTTESRGEIKVPQKKQRERPTIGHVSKLTGCNIETIRYYERIGLLPKPPRTEGGFRLYNREHVKRLNFIRRSRKLGFPLDEVRDLVSLMDTDSYTCAQVKRLTVNHLDHIEQKIADLTKLKTVLSQMASECEGGNVPQCPIIATLSK